MNPARQSYGILCILLMFAPADNASAASRMAEAEVQAVNGIPCFTIFIKEEMRNGQPYLGALTVSDLSDEPVSEVWGFKMTGDKKVLLSSGSCLM